MRAMLVGRGGIEPPQPKARVLQTLGLTTCPTDPRSGGDEGTRTPDPRDANAVLSQLSYIPTAAAPGTIRVDRPGSVARNGPQPALAGSLDSVDAHRSRLGLLASLAWGVTDLSGALATRRVGSVGVLAGTQLTSLAVLARDRRREPLAARRGDPAAASRCGLFARDVRRAVAYLAFFAALRIGPISVVSARSSRRTAGSTVVLAVLLPGRVAGAGPGAGRRASRRLGIVLAGLVLGGSIRGDADRRARASLVALVTMALFAILTVALAGADPGPRLAAGGARVAGREHGRRRCSCSCSRWRGASGPLGRAARAAGRVRARGRSRWCWSPACATCSGSSRTRSGSRSPRRGWSAWRARSGRRSSCAYAVAFLGRAAARRRSGSGLGLLAAGLVVLALAG